MKVLSKMMRLENGIETYNQKGLFVSTLILKSNENSFETFMNQKIKESDADIYCVDRIFRNNKFSSATGPVQCLAAVLALAQQLQLKKYKKIIVFDSRILILMLFFIKARECRLILWLWNTVSEKRAVKILKMCKICEIWTFDEKNAKDYGFYWNSQFFFSNQDKERSNNISGGIFFVGVDKGRISQLLSIKKQCEKQGVSVDFNVFPDKGKHYSLEEKEILCTEFMQYDEVLKRVQNCKAIVDLVKEGQTGMTMRVLEGTFYSKKIITNNISLTKTNIYIPNNVFIIGYDNYSDLSSFLDKALLPWPQEIIDYYSFPAWIKRFV